MIGATFAVARLRTVRPELEKGPTDATELLFLFSSGDALSRFSGESWKVMTSLWCLRSCIILERGELNCLPHTEQVRRGLADVGGGSVRFSGDD